MSACKPDMKGIVYHGKNSRGLVALGRKRFNVQHRQADGCPPNELDVYFGRSPTAVRAAGNQRLRALVDEKLPEYEHYRATDNVADRTALISMVYKCIKSSGARFLKKKAGKWVEATTKEGRAKISHLFRDHKNSTSKTDKQRPRGGSSVAVSAPSDRLSGSILAGPSCVELQLTLLSESDGISPDQEESTVCTDTTTASSGYTSAKSENIGETTELWEELRQSVVVSKVNPSPNKKNVVESQNSSCRAQRTCPSSPSFPPASIDVNKRREELEPIPLGKDFVNYCALDEFSVDLESLVVEDCLLDPEEDETVTETTKMTTQRGDEEE